MTNQVERKNKVLRQVSPFAARKGINLFPLVAVSWIMTIYLLATENLSWYTWVFVGFLVFERLTLQLGLLLQRMMIRQAEKHLMEELKKVMGDSGMPQFGSLGPPDTPSE